MALIDFYIRNQKLSKTGVKLIADSVNYVDCSFTFKTDDWNGFDKWVVFSKGGESYRVNLVDDKIPKEAGLNLAEGLWNVSLFGENPQGTERITTNSVTVEVEKSAIQDGEPLPQISLTEAEQISAKAQMALDVANEVLAKAENGEFDGKDGEPGKPGAQGIQGVHGKDGYTPIKGVDYFDGAPGENATPEQIAEAVKDYFEENPVSGGEDKFVVTFLVEGENQENVTADKTYAEIDAAYKAGKKVVALLGGNASAEFKLSIFNIFGYTFTFIDPGVDNDSNCSVAVYEFYYSMNGTIKFTMGSARIPTKTSQLENDSGFITINDIPESGGSAEVTAESITEALGFPPTSAEDVERIAKEAIDENEFVVTVRVILGNTCIADKTFAEIETAYEAGKNVVAVLSDKPYIKFNLAEVTSRYQFTFYHIETYIVTDETLTVYASQIDITAGENVTYYTSQKTIENGGKGEDGISPIVEITEITGGNRVSITDIEGTKTFNVMDGEKGDKGDPGAQGIQGEPGVKGDKGDTGEKGEPGATGAKGDKGDKGEQGIQGIQGEDGEDGFSIYAITSVGKVDPDDNWELETAEVKVEYGKSVKIGDLVFSAGDNNLYRIKELMRDSLYYVDKVGYLKGEKGADGKTPVKGTDYFTAADKTEMVNAVIAALPKYAGGVS